MLDESITGSMDAFMGGKMTPEIKTMLEAGDAARAKGGSVKDMIAAVKSANPAAGAGPAVFIGGQPAAMGGQQAPPVDPIVRLERLAKLHAQGVLTDEEFQAQKTKLLAET
jgi:hypothetical protein